MTTIITSICDGVHLFVIFATCLCVLWETCETVTVTAFSTSSFFVTVWIKAKQSVHTVWSHSCALRRKRDFVETIPCCHSFYWLVVGIDQEDTESFSFGVLVLCLLYFRHLLSTQKEHNNNHIGTVSRLWLCGRSWRLEIDFRWNIVRSEVTRLFQ